MGKLKKQKNKGHESPKLLATALLEEKTAADLDRQNYGRAKEWLKELCKRNKELYQPRLIACRFLRARIEDVGRFSDEPAGFAPRPVEILFPGALPHELQSRG
jgi:hypothetical protein